jgi:hypothetical protein
MFDLDDALFSISGSGQSNELGYQVAAGDLDGDGTDELIVSSPYVSDYTTFMYSYGSVWVVNGASSGDITASSADATLTGNASSEYFGTDITTGDVNGDGMDDLLVAGAYAYPSKVTLFMGPVSSMTSASADTTFTTSTYGQFGDNIALANLDGDEYMDTAIGEPYDYTTSYYGNVYIYTGPVTGAVSSPDVMVQGVTMYGYGGKVANMGDADSDGFDNLAQGSYYGGATQQGEVYILDDPTASTGTVSASTIALATVTGEQNYEQFGYKLAGGDYNDDGYSDLFVQASNYNDGVTYGLGRVYGFFGPLSGAVSASSADFMVTGTTSYSQLGYDLALDDVSGDGKADLVVGYPYSDNYIGQAFIFAGPASGALDLSAAETLAGADDATTSQGYIGYSVGTIGDWSGDGIGDVVIGAIGVAPDSTLSFAGRAWVLASDDL